MKYNYIETAYCRGLQIYSCFHKEIIMNLKLFSENLKPFSVGFDNFFQEVDSILDQKKSYPPYNIIDNGDDTFEIQVAVAGFKKEQVDIVYKDNNLTIKGKQNNKEAKESRVYIHHGIGVRQFKRVFRLASGVEVDSASYEDGILSVKLSLSEDKKAKTIEIN